MKMKKYSIPLCSLLYWECAPKAQQQKSRKGQLFIVLYSERQTQIVPSFHLFLKN